MPDESIWDEMTPEERVQAVVEDPSLLQEPPAPEVVEQMAATGLGQAEAEEIPPEPGADGDLRVAPLAVREAAKLAGMSDEQRARYDAANAELMANPTVAAFAAEEERARVAKEQTKAAFLAAYRKKQKA